MKNVKIRDYFTVAFTECRIMLTPMGCKFNVNSLDLLGLKLITECPIGIQAEIKRSGTGLVVIINKI